MPKKTAAEAAQDAPGLDYKTLKQYYDISSQMTKLEADKKKLNGTLKKLLGAYALKDLKERIKADRDETNPSMKLSTTTLAAMMKIVNMKDEDEALKKFPPKFVAEDLLASIIPQDRSKIDNDLTVGFILNEIDSLECKLHTEEGILSDSEREDLKLKITKLKACTKKVLIPVEEAIDAAIYNGAIIPSEFKRACIQENIIVTLKVSKVKEGEV
jgi:hypothetical protein